MAHTYLTDRVYEALRKKILECEYPPGAVLNEAALVKEFGSSRTPMHNAIISLAAENLVTVIPKKGVIVNGITLNDVLEVYDVRSMIEPEVVSRYGDLLPRDYLQEYLERCHAATELQEKIRLDEELHSRLYSVCRNHYLRDILYRLEGHNHRNRVWRSNESRVNASMREHEEIVRALLAGETELAAQKMREHITNARDYAIRKYL